MTEQEKIETIIRSVTSGAVRQRLLAMTFGPASPDRLKSLLEEAEGDQKILEAFLESPAARRTVLNDDVRRLVFAETVRKISAVLGTLRPQVQQKNREIVASALRRARVILEHTTEAEAASSSPEAQDVREEFRRSAVWR